MKLIDEREDLYVLPILVQAKHVELGKGLWRIIERSHARADRQLKEVPQVNDHDMRQDFRYKLGYIEALHDIMRLPEQAATILSGG